MENKIKKILEDYKVYGAKQDSITEELLNLFSVSQQRELLQSFADWMHENINFDGIGRDEIDSYLKEKEMLNNRSSKNT